MSIGLHSRRAAARTTLNWESEPGLFVEGTGSYTWRGNVTLNRDAYYDGERLVMSNEVAMPDVVDYTFRVGYWKHGLYLPVSFTRQITAGGHDIRRQDSPFVSNRMNFSRVDVVAAYYPKSPRFVFRAGVSHILGGRNVGKSSWRTKFYYFNPRPSQLDPSIKTRIGLPNFPSYVSGHSSFSAAAAAVLAHLFPGSASSFEAMRDEAAISRLYAAIHYRSDIEAGKDCGRRGGGYTVAFARQDGAD